MHRRGALPRGEGWEGGDGELKTVRFSEVETVSQRVV